MERIQQWLERIGLSQYSELFAENDIDCEVLSDLTEQDLKDLGISLGHRKKLLKAIGTLSDPETVEKASINPKPANPESALTPDLSAVVSQAELRHLTVMFCDLVGSTELSVKYDAEDFREILNGYHACCERIIKQFDGFIARYMGDGLLAYFGYPRTTEYEAEQAVRAGLALVDAIAGLAPRPELHLQSRVGIATGEVVVGDLGEGSARERAVAGETPNLAARLQALAKPGAVIIAENTQRLIGDLFEYTDIGRHSLKGFERLVHAWQVDGERMVESRFDARSGAKTPIIGRGGDLNLLLDRWERVKSGDGQVVYLAGEAGIGKSRIIKALRDHVAQEAVTRLNYQCSPNHVNSALHPIIGQMERAAGFTDDDSAEQKLDKLEQLLGQATTNVTAVAPLFANLLSIPTGTRYPPHNLNPQRQKQKTMEALLDQLLGLARKQPVLFLVEDAHWIDPTTLELMESTIAGVQDIAVLVVITFRPEFSPSWGNYSHVTSLTLNRLSRAQVTVLVDKVTNGKTLPDEVLAQIVEKTDGVPLFVEELTKTVLESGLLKESQEGYTLDGPLPPFAVPGTLQDSLVARLDRLGSIKEVAQIGAVLGRQFSHQLLSMVSPLGDASLQDALAQLLQAELIYRRGNPPEAVYTFKHALVQDAAYHTLLRSKRQALHARIANVLESQFPDTVATEPELLAHHCTEAGLASQAIEYWRRAGQLAVKRSANIEAIAHYNQALVLVKTQPDDDARHRQELALHIALGAPLIATRGWSAPQVELTYAAAYDLCHKLKQDSELFPALRGVWGFHLMRGEMAQARTLAEQLVDHTHVDSHQELELEAWLAFGMTAFWLGDFVTSRDWLQRVDSRYDPDKHRSHALLFGTDPGAAQLFYQARVYWHLGYPDQALALSRQAVALADGMEHPHSLAWAMAFNASLHLLRREWEAGRRQAEATTAYSNEYGLPFWTAWGKVLCGRALAEQGHGDDGIKQLQEGINAYRAIGGGVACPYFYALLAETLDKLGRTEEALTVLEEARAKAEQNHNRSSLAEMLRLKGELLIAASRQRAGDAEECFLQALNLAHQQQAKALELRAATSLGRLWSGQGRAPEAKEMLAPIYHWFSEGHDLADLRDAEKLL